jgi:hypothetical protein
MLHLFENVTVVKAIVLLVLPLFLFQSLFALVHSIFRVRNFVRLIVEFLVCMFDSIVPDVEGE